MVFNRYRLMNGKLGLLCSLGVPSISVFRQPRVAVFSTGDEVQELGRPLRPGQIYDRCGFL